MVRKGSCKVLWNIVRHFWHFAKLLAFWWILNISFLWSPQTWFWVRKLRNQRISNQEVWQGDRQIHVNLKEVAKYLCFYRRWFFVSFSKSQYYIQLLLTVLIKYHSLTWKVLHILHVFLCDSWNLCNNYEFGSQGIWTATWKAEVIWTSDCHYKTLVMCVY